MLNGQNSTLRCCAQMPIRSKVHFQLECWLQILETKFLVGIENTDSVFKFCVYEVSLLDAPRCMKATPQKNTVEIPSEATPSFISWLSMAGLHAACIARYFHASTHGPSLMSACIYLLCFDPHSGTPNRLQFSSSLLHLST